MDSFYLWAFSTAKVGKNAPLCCDTLKELVWCEDSGIGFKKILGPFWTNDRSFDHFYTTLLFDNFRINLRETLAPCLKLNFQSIWYIAYFIWPVVASFVANRWNTVLFAAKMSFTRCELKKMKNCVASQPCSLHRPAALPLRSQGFAYCQYSLEKIWLKHFSLLFKRLIWKDILWSPGHGHGAE